ncbi:MAG: DUF2911 domain-containing protein [Bacteroidota bacterium]|nr:DUF2911 domain-containing protein [Bacteroidota bacterium]
MKHIIAVFLLGICFTASAQTVTSKIPPLDKSPMDMSYYPSDYPILKIQDKVTEPLVMRVIYSRPQLNGRKVFGGLQQYGDVWRLGANEATEIDFYKDVIVNKVKINKGRYTLYAIPFPDKWTVIINKETDTWGSFRYDSTKDVVRVSLPVNKNEVTEDMTILFEKTASGANMNMYWADVFVSLPIFFKND